MRQLFNLYRCLVHLKKLLKLLLMVQIAKKCAKVSLILTMTIRRLFLG